MRVCVPIVLLKGMQSLSRISDKSWPGCSDMFIDHHAAGWRCAMCLFVLSSYLSRVSSAFRRINDNKVDRGAMTSSFDHLAAGWGSVDLPVCTLIALLRGMQVAFADR